MFRQCDVLRSRTAALLERRMADDDLDLGQGHNREARQSALVSVLRKVCKAVNNRLFDIMQKLFTFFCGGRYGYWLSY